MLLKGRNAAQVGDCSRVCAVQHIAPAAAEDLDTEPRILLQVLGQF